MANSVSYKKTTILLFVFLCFFAAVPVQAFELKDMFNPSSKDTDLILNGVLKPLFGYKESFDYRSPITPYAEAFAQGLLIVGSIIIAYNVWTGTLDTSKTGDVLGQKANPSYWMLRLTTGAGLLIPLGGSGFSTIVHVVVFLFAQGILFANTVNEIGIDRRFEGRIHISLASREVVYKNFKNALTSAICLESASRFERPSTSGQSRIWGVTSNVENPSYEEGRVDYSPNKVYRYGYKTSGGNTNDAAICGSFQLPIIANTNKNKNGIDSSTFDKTFFETSAYNGMKSAVQNAYNSVFESALEDVKAIAKKYVDEVSLESNTSSRQLNGQQENNLRNEVQKLLNSYFQRVEQEINKEGIFKYNEEYSNKLKEKGFVAAGGHFFQTSVIVQKLNEIANSPVDAEYVYPLGFYAERTKGVDSASTSYKGVNRLREISPDTVVDLENFNESLKKVMKTVNISSKRDVKHSPEEEDSDDVLKKMINSSSGAKDFISLNVSSGNNYHDFGDTKNRQSFSEYSLLDVQTTGITIFNSALAFLGAGVLAAALGRNWAAKLVTAGASGEVLSFLSPIFYGIFLAMLTPGVLLGFYIPLMPFILWLGVVFGIMTLLFEAIFGSMLLALAFLIPDRDGFLGRQGQGIMLIFALTVKPTLAIIGLYSAELLVNPLLYFINILWDEVTSSVLSDVNVITALFGKLVLFIFYYVIIHKVVLQCFSLIYVVSDSIMQFLGGFSGASIGRYSQNLESSSTAGVAAVGLGAVIGQGIQGGLGRLQSKRQHEDNKNAHDANRLESKGLDTLNSYLGAETAVSDAAERESNNLRNQFNLGQNSNQSSVDDGVSGSSAKEAFGTASIGSENVDLGESLASERASSGDFGGLTSATATGEENNNSPSFNGLTPNTDAELDNAQGNIEMPSTVASKETEQPQEFNSLGSGNNVEGVVGGEGGLSSTQTATQPTSTARPLTEFEKQNQNAVAGVLEARTHKANAQKANALYSGIKAAEMNRQGYVSMAGIGDIPVREAKRQFNDLMSGFGLNGNATLQGSQQQFIHDLGNAARSKMAHANARAVQGNSAALALMTSAGAVVGAEPTRMTASPRMSDAIAAANVTKSVASSTPSVSTSSEESVSQGVGVNSSISPASQSYQPEATQSAQEPTASSLIGASSPYTIPVKEGPVEKPMDGILHNSALNSFSLKEALAGINKKES